MHQIQAEIGIPKIATQKLGDNHAIFTVGPLPSGYGMTLGNALRRVLLSSLPGTAVTSVKIEGASHEYMALDGMKDTVLSLILNLKQLQVKKHTKEPSTLTLKIQKEGDVKAGEIKAASDVEILNPDFILTTLAKNSKINLEITVEKGVGYTTASSRESKNQDPSLILVDAFFSPVKKVRYDVQAARVGQMTNLDKLEIEILTNGAISAEDALKFAANIVKSYFSLFDTGIKPPEAEFMTEISPIVEKKEESTAVEVIPQEAKYTPIEVLNLSPRTLNALINGGIGSVEELVKRSPDQLANLRGFGKKAMDEVALKLKERGLKLAEGSGLVEFKEEDDDE